MDNQYDKNEKMTVTFGSRERSGKNRRGCLSPSSFSTVISDVEVTQKVRKPAEDTFKKTEYFYVASRAYTLDADTIFIREYRYFRLGGTDLHAAGNIPDKLPLPAP